jgi:hypothetical protein
VLEFCENTIRLRSLWVGLTLHQEQEDVKSQVRGQGVCVTRERRVILLEDDGVMLLPCENLLLDFWDRDLPGSRKLLQNGFLSLFPSPQEVRPAICHLHSSTSSGYTCAIASCDPPTDGCRCLTEPSYPIPAPLYLSGCGFGNFLLFDPSRSPLGVLQKEPEEEADPKGQKGRV